MVMDTGSTHYEGEDTRPTSDRELWGWYSYGLAAEVFTVCGVGSFLPMTLEQLAREVGVLHTDRTKPCVPPSSTSIPPHVLRRDENQCVVDLFGHELNTSSFTLYAFSLAIVVQTLVLISIGAVADYGSNRKRMLLVLSFTGATSSMLFIFVYPDIFFVGLLLTIISVASLGSSFVLLNSFLPLLVANHPSIRDKEGFDSIPLDDIDSNSDHEETLDDDDPLADNLPTNSLLNTQPLPAAALASLKVSPSLTLSNSFSAKGIGIGYTASVLVQLTSIGIIVLYSHAKKKGSNFPATMPMRTVLFLVGFTWAVFTIPTAIWLRRRPGLPLPWKATNTSQNKFVAGFRYVAFAWVSLWKTMKIAAQLREILIFLLGWFLLSDGVATITGTAILFARTELKLGPAAVALLSITATASGIVGAICWPKIERRFQLKSISVILSCIFLFELIPLYGLLGFIPFIKNLGVIGLQQWWEIYPLGSLLGFIMGGISSYCRSVYGSLVPPGMEAAFYALFAVTDKGSSVIGPAIVGRIIDVTGSIRMGFWFLSLLMISPAPFFWFVDVEKGRVEGLRMAQCRNSSTRELDVHDTEA